MKCILSKSISGAAKKKAFQDEFNGVFNFRMEAKTTLRFPQVKNKSAKFPSRPLSFQFKIYDTMKFIQFSLSIIRNYLLPPPRPHVLDHAWTKFKIHRVYFPFILLFK